MTVETGSYFVSNYPPFAAWRGDVLEAIDAVLDAPPVRDVPLGVYVHIPFCRKRCRFCYFKVYTDTPAAEIRRYVEGLGAEARRYAERAVIGGRRPSFVYFGGGTPSYLSADQLRQLFSEVRSALPWGDDAEITFECEPGTLRQPKVDALRALGVTRLSLGVESLHQQVLELNGRAHGEAQIQPAFDMARAAGFPQINLDLIAGMIGETEESWAEGIERVVAMAPDSVTIYQMEIPGNTGIFHSLREHGGKTDGLGGSLADAATRRRWTAEAFARLEKAGYRLSSGYTAVRGDVEQTFVYRNSLWHGADLLPIGVSAFGHVQGAHVQNEKHLEAWLTAVEAGGLSHQRGLVLSDTERLIRELVLQLKLGSIDLGALRAKFGVDPWERFASAWAGPVSLGLVRKDGDRATLSREGLMQVDRLLPAFFLSVHGGVTEGVAA